MVDSPYYEQLVREHMLDPHEVPADHVQEEVVVEEEDTDDVDGEADVHPGYGFGV